MTFAYCNTRLRVVYCNHNKGKHRNTKQEVHTTKTNYPILTKQNAVIGNKYASAGDGYITLNRIYRITEQQAAENWISCLDRYEAVTNKGDTLNSAFPDSDLFDFNRWN